MASQRLVSFRISDEREAEIQDLAAVVATSHCPTMPVAPLCIVEKKRITYSFNHYGHEFDGMLEHRRGRFHIYCNLDRVERAGSTRARFTIAHELGHYFIDDHRHALESGRTPTHPSRCEFESKNPVEREADYFASALLMPPTIFSAKARKVPRGLEGIRQLANHFNASLTSAALRYAQAEIIPCAVLKWTTEGRSWSCTSTETSRAKLITTIATTNKLPADCATAQALRGDKPPPSGIFQCGTTASAWFNYADESSEQNPILIEQAVTLGRYGVLTLLYPHEGKY